MCAVFYLFVPCRAAVIASFKFEGPSVIISLPNEDLRHEQKPDVKDLVHCQLCVL